MCGVWGVPPHPRICQGDAGTHLGALSHWVETFAVLKALAGWPLKLLLIAVTSLACFSLRNGIIFFLFWGRFTQGQLSGRSAAALREAAPQSPSGCRRG